MTTFSVTITNQARLAGISAARAAYNDALTLTAAQGTEGEEGYIPEQRREDHPDFIASDEAYVQFVMARAAESYARQYG